MSSSLDNLELCRLCLVKDRVSVPIFEDEGDVRQIFLKITACLPVKVSREDKLPKKICDDCVYKVELFYQFWNTTANAEKQLLQWLDEVGGLEDKQGYITNVLDSNVMKQERNSDNRLDGNVMQVSGHQNNMDIGMIENMTIMTMPAGDDQQFTAVPMDASGTVQTVQAVPGPSNQTPHDQMAQSQSHLVEEEEEDMEDDNSDDGCDNEEGLPVKEETEDQSDQPLEPTAFVNVPLPCDEAGPSGLQQQKISEISEMSMQQTAADGDPKTGYISDTNDSDLKYITASGNSEDQQNSGSSMTLYQITYVNGEASYSLVPIKKKSATPNKQGTNALSSKELCCEECGLKFATEMRLKYHRSTHKPLQNKKKKSQQQIDKDPLKLRKFYRLIVPETYVEPEETEFEEQVTINKVSKKNLTFFCPSCEYSTDSRSIMIEHFTNSHCVQQTELKEETVDEIEEEEEAEEIAQEVEVDEEEQETIVEEQETIEEEPDNAIEHLVCEQCGFTGYTQDDIDFHTCEPADKTASYSCHLCTYECPTSMGLQSHITRKHKPRPTSGQPRVYECGQCEFKSEKKNVIYTHRKRHRVGVATNEGQYSYFCNECDFSARSKSALYLHIRRRHKTDEHESIKQTRPELYQCDQCDYTNKNKYDVKVHVIRKHTNDYNHACEICGKKYKIKGDLTNHIRFQHREQPIICDVCGKTCGNSNSLYVHQKFAHYKAEFECPICHRRMVSQANLDEHILKQHEQREDAVCEECGKTFTRQSRLKIHMRIHTGLKPHTCKICGKAFSRKTALRQHLLIHTGQRPYVCDICGKAFTQKPGLISHRKSHPGSHPPLPRVTIDHVLSEFFNEEES